MDPAAEADATEPTTEEPEPTTDEAEPTAEESDPAPTSADPEPPPPELAPAPIEIVDLDAPEPGERTGRKRVAVAPFALGAGLATRPRTTASAMATLGIRFAQVGRLSASLDLAVVGNHQVNLPGARPSFNAFEGHATTLYRFNRTLSLGPSAGLSYRTFIQDAAQIQQIFVPEVGAAGALTLLGGRWWGIRWVTQGTWDLRTLELQPAGNPSQELAHFSVKSYISFVFGDRVDPFVEKRTSRE